MDVKPSSDKEILSAIPADTTPEAARVHYRSLARLGAAGRAKMTFELCDQLRVLARAGVRYRHPDYSEEMVKLAIVRIMLGEELFHQVHPGVDIQP